MVDLLNVESTQNELQVQAENKENMVFKHSTDGSYLGIIINNFKLYSYRTNLFILTSNSRTKYCD